MATFDRVSDREIVNDLLNGHLEWRERLVQQFEFAGATAEARVTSSYDIRLSKDFRSRRSLPDWGTVRLVLPLGSRRKELLLRASLTGPNHEDAHLVLRTDCSEYQADYLRWLLTTCPSRLPIRAGLINARPPGLAALPDELWIREFLRAICDFTPDRAVQHVKLRNRRAKGIDALAVFLTTWKVIEPGPTHQQVLDWYHALGPVRQKFGSSPRPDTHLFSSSEMPVLVLGELKTSWTPAEVSAFIDRYVEAVTAAVDDSDRPFIDTLAEYGREFEVLVEATIPLGRSCSVHLSEDRPLGGRTTVRQTLALGEAQSVHVEARVDDHIVEFGGWPYTIPRRSVRGKPVLEYRDGTRVTPALAFDDWRATTETIALYSRTRREGEPVDLIVGMRATMLSRWTTWMFAALNILAAIEVPLASHDGVYVERLGVLVVPTTLAATVVLAREQSALSARIQLPARLVLLATLVVLWITTLAEVVYFVAPHVGM